MRDEAVAPSSAAVLATSGDDVAEMAAGDDARGPTDETSTTILQLSLRSPLSGSRIKFPNLTFSSEAAWCGKTNIIACATETCARDPGSKQKPTFWIPIHLVDPERPTEHAVFDVPADSPCDSIESIEWSPPACERALLVANTRGRVTTWVQPSEGHSNVARAFNCWACEYEWRQDQAVVTKWLFPSSPYRWTDAKATTQKGFEEKFLATGQITSARWPNFLCACTVLSSGAVQLRWRQWPLSKNSHAKWFSSSKGVLAAGPSGIYAADVIINESGSLLVAGVPIGNPSTVVIWEVTPGGVNNQQLVNLASLSLNPPSWPGIAPLAAYLLNWQKLPSNELKTSNAEFLDADGALLQCSPVSNLSAYVNPNAGAHYTAAWGSGVTAVAFDPSCAGSALAVVVVEGHYTSPNHPDGGPSMTGWRFQRWESSRQQVAIHSIFEAGATNYGAISLPVATTWKKIVDKSFPQTKLAVAYARTSTANGLDSADVKDDKFAIEPTEPLPVIKCITKVRFSMHGGEVAVGLLGGEVHIFSGPDFVPVENFCVKIGILVVEPALSASGCCLSCAWHDEESDTTFLRVVRVQQPPCDTVPLERQIADRFWWSLVTELDWWDAVAYSQNAAEESLVSLASVAAVLDSDFHSLASSTHRQHYGPALDRIKCRMLEGAEATDMRALVLDMQARLLLDVLGKGIEAALITPSTLILDPWQAPSETLTGLGGDAMLVDPALVHQIQSYVDVVLDLASHFLTRLRRYASFCRTLANVNNSSSSANSANRASAASGPAAIAQAAAAGAAAGTTTLAPASASTIASEASATAAQTAMPAVTATATTATSTSGQGGTQPSGPSSNGGAAQVQAWVQGAIAKINSSEGGAAVTGGAGSTGGTAISAQPAASSGGGSTAAAVAPAVSGPSPLAVGTSTFPGIPAVRLLKDCYFLHRLCQLLLFCLVFRKRQLPRYIGGVTQKVATVKNEDGQATKLAQVQSGKPSEDRVGNGNAGQGYTADEVKYLFLVLLDLCKRTSQLPHPFPKYPAGTGNQSFRLHYIEGQFSVAPEIVEASLGPHMQNLPRPRGSDPAGLLMRELELHPPAEEWNKRIICGGASSWLEDRSSSRRPEPDSLSRKRRYAERDAACGIETAVGLGSFTGFMGSRRDVVTSSWKTVLHAVWHKCMRCGRQTASLVPPKSPATMNSREVLWTGRWAFACPMCGGHWVRVV